ncbi:MAG: ribosome-associated translation inhibitor RaiA [Patescibacteria group bacterium]|nr:ribosome-associated translation inhibitor RaiA [Patescibacteria group bacterium]
MNINYKSTNTSLTQSDKDYIADKLESLASFMKDGDKAFIETEIDKKHKSGLVFRMEISINPPKYYAEARGNDFYEALDLALPKIKEQLAKQKDKKISLRRRKKRAA